MPNDIADMALFRDMIEAVRDVLPRLEQERTALLKRIAFLRAIVAAQTTLDRPGAPLAAGPQLPLRRKRGRPPKRVQTVGKG